MCVSAWYHERKTPIVFQPDYISHSEVMGTLLISYVIPVNTFDVTRYLKNILDSLVSYFVPCSLYHERKTPIFFSLIAPVIQKLTVYYGDLQGPP